jgi:hypothetical protein
LAKQEGMDARLHDVCTTCIEAFRLLSLMLKPVLPSLASHVEKFLNIEAMNFTDVKASLGTGHAINHSTGVGNAWREGSGPGDAIRSGAGQGHAYRLDSGPGQALRNGQGHGDALHFGLNPGMTARLDSGMGQTWNSTGALARQQAIYSPQR